jgi:hypothetical protein
MRPASVPRLVVDDTVCESRGLHVTTTSARMPPEVEGETMSADHDATDDHDHDDNADGEDPLGPVDIDAWGAGVLGVAIALVMAACFVIATSSLG